MGLFSNVRNFFGAIFDNEEEEKARRRRVQQEKARSRPQAPQQQRQQSSAPMSWDDPVTISAPLQKGAPKRPDNGITLTTTTTTTRKPAPKKDVLDVVSNLAAKLPSAPAAIAKNMLGLNTLEKVAGGTKPVRGLRAITTGNERSAQGGAQGVSGLVDLISPGKGTSRFSKDLDEEAKKTDKVVADNKLNVPLYKAGQAAGDLAQFAIGGGLVKAATKGKDLPKGIQLATKSEVFNKVVKGATDARLALGNAGQQAFYTGQKASKGEDINPLREAGEFGAAQVGIPVIGAAAAKGIKKVSTGVRSVNPNQEADAAKQIAEQAPPQPEPLPPTEQLKQLDADAKTRVLSDQEIQTRNDLRAQEQMLAQVNDPSDTPAYLRKPEKDRQMLEADRQEELDTDILDIPTFQRRGPDPAAFDEKAFDDTLKQRSTEIASDPALSDSVGRAYRETGSEDPFSLVMYTLAKSGNKAGVRSLVQRLVPDIEGNNLNRTVNAVTGADNTGDVIDALSEGGRNVRTPDRPLGNVVPNQPTPAPSAAPEQIAPQAPVVAPAVEVPRSVPSPGAPTAALVPEQAPAVVPTPAPAPVAQVADAPLPVQQVAPDAPQVAPDQMPALQTTGEVAEAAPNLRDAFLRTLGDADGNVGKAAPERDVINLDELRARASEVVRGKPIEDVRAYYTVSADELKTLVKSPQEYALARASLDVLYDAYNVNKDDATSNLISDIIDAMEYGSSESGQFLRVTQEAFDKLPIPIKISKVVRRVKALNADAKKPKINLDDPAAKSVLEAQVQAIFDTQARYLKDIADLDAILAKGINEPGSVTLKQLKEAGNAKEEVLDAMKLNDNKFAHILTDVSPNEGWGKKAGDWQRSAMLSAPTGRVGDVVTTSLNMLQTATEQFAEGVAGKAINAGRMALGKAPGKYTSSGMSAGEVFKALPKAFTKAKRDFQGTGDVGDIYSLIKGNTADNRSDITGVIGSKFKRGVRGATQFATHWSEGVANSELKRIARQEGIKQGLKGDELKKYTVARQYTPTPDAQAKARLAHEEVNNLNDNKLTKVMRDIGNTLEKNGGPVGSIIKNAIMPFPTWIGGNMWNTITNKNVIAATIKAGAAVVKGDAQGAVKALSSGMLTNGVGLMGAGYIMAEQGWISDTDANGDSYEGLYLHIGDDYTPITALGFFAPNIALGSITHKVMNDKDGDPDSVLENIGQGMLSTVGVVLKSLSVSQLTGGDNVIARGLDAAFGANENRPDKLVDTASSVVAQFIPAGLRDVNAGLDNYTNLNPTKEKSETKVLNAEGNKDYVKSSAEKLKDRIPGWSQSLPRKANVAAQDFSDRLFRGNRATPGGKAAEAEKQAQLSLSEDLKKRGIPDPNAKYENGATFDSTVKARFEEGNYDAAIEGLQLKLKEKESNKDIPASSLKDLKNQISLYEVHKETGVEPEFDATYKEIGVDEWREMGDGDGVDDDPDLYQKLFDYDNARTAKGISGKKDNKEKNKYYAEKEKTGKGGGGGRGGGGGGRGGADRDAANELSRIKSNTLGDAPSLARISLDDLAPQKATQLQKIPQLQELRSSDLVKKRKITLSKG